MFTVFAWSIATNTLCKCMLFVKDEQEIQLCIHFWGELGTQDWQDLKKAGLENPTTASKTNLADWQHCLPLLAELSLIRVAVAPPLSSDKQDKWYLAGGCLDATTAWQTSVITRQADKSAGFFSKRVPGLQVSRAGVRKLMPCKSQDNIVVQNKSKKFWFVALP